MYSGIHNASQIKQQMPLFAKRGSVTQRPAAPRVASALPADRVTFSGGPKRDIYSQMATLLQEEFDLAPSTPQERSGLIDNAAVLFNVVGTIQEIPQMAELLEAEYTVPVEKVARMLGKTPAEVPELIRDTFHFVPQHPEQGISGLLTNLLILRQVFGLDPIAMKDEHFRITPELNNVLKRNLLYIQNEIEIPELWEKEPASRLQALTGRDQEGLNQLLRENFGLPVANPERGISKILANALYISELFGLEYNHLYETDSRLSDDFSSFVMPEELHYLEQSNDRRFLTPVTINQSQLKNGDDLHAFVARVIAKFGLPPQTLPDGQLQLSKGLIDYVYNSVVPFHTRMEQPDSTLFPPEPESAPEPIPEPASEPALGSAPKSPVTDQPHTSSGVTRINMADLLARHAGIKANGTPAGKSEASTPADTAYDKLAAVSPASEAPESPEETPSGDERLHPPGDEKVLDYTTSSGRVIRFRFPQALDGQQDDDSEAPEPISSAATTTQADHVNADSPTAPPSEALSDRNPVSDTNTIDLRGWEGSTPEGLEGAADPEPQDTLIGTGPEPAADDIEESVSEARVDADSAPDASELEDDEPRDPGETRIWSVPPADGQEVGRHSATSVPEEESSAEPPESVAATPFHRPYQPSPTPREDVKGPSWPTPPSNRQVPVRMVQPPTSPPDTTPPSSAPPSGKNRRFKMRWLVVPALLAGGVGVAAGQNPGLLSDLTGGDTGTHATPTPHSNPPAASAPAPSPPVAPAPTSAPRPTPQQQIQQCRDDLAAYYSNPVANAPEGTFKDILQSASNPNERALLLALDYALKVDAQDARQSYHYMAVELEAQCRPNPQSDPSAVEYQVLLKHARDRFSTELQAANGDERKAIANFFLNGAVTERMNNKNIDMQQKAFTDFVLQQKQAIQTSLLSSNGGQLSETAIQVGMSMHALTSGLLSTSNLPAGNDLSLLTPPVLDGLTAQVTQAVQNQNPSLVNPVLRDPNFLTALALAQTMEGKPGDLNAAVNELQQTMIQQRVGVQKALQDYQVKHGLSPVFTPTVKLILDTLQNGIYPTGDTVYSELTRP